MFLKGTESPLGNDLINKDELFEALVEPVEEVNNRVVQIVPPVAQALHELLERMVADHLPGGRFLTVTEALKDTADSVVPCNKLLEFSFGVLDYQLRFRPHATTIVNESFLMYSMNKTRHWLQEMDVQEKSALMVEA